MDLHTGINDYAKALDKKGFSLVCCTRCRAMTNESENVRTAADRTFCIFEAPFLPQHYNVKLQTSNCLPAAVQSFVHYLLQILSVKLNCCT